MKLGFVHIPRTGGTYLERVLSDLGPQKFVNFFGQPSNQIENKVVLIELIEKDATKCEKILKNPNWETCVLFTGHFSLNIQKCVGSDEDIEYFTILRDPVQRVTSFVKKVTSSKTFNEIMNKDVQSVHDNVFWKNFENYVLNKDRRGLMSHERHGFSNYMTKAIAGLDLSNENIIVDDNIYETAKNNLDKMKYVGLFEEYTKTVEDILNLFELKSNFSDSGLKISKIPDSTFELISKLNEYDIKLYNYFKEKNV